MNPIAQYNAMDLNYCHINYVILELTVERFGTKQDLSRKTKPKCPHFPLPTDDIFTSAVVRGPGSGLLCLTHGSFEAVKPKTIKTETSFSSRCIPPRPRRSVIDCWTGAAVRSLVSATAC